MYLKIAIIYLYFILTFYIIKNKKISDFKIFTFVCYLFISEFLFLYILTNNSFYLIYICLIVILNYLYNLLNKYKDENIINNGIVNFKVMEKNNISFKTLINELNRNEIKNIKEEHVEPLSLKIGYICVCLIIALYVIIN